MNRIKPYDIPHKGLRNALSQLSLLAGKTNYSDQEEVANLYHLGTDVFNFLTIHARDEDEITLTELEIRCPGSTLHDSEDHERIHIKQDRLEKLLSKIYTDSRSGNEVNKEGAEFYLAFSEFQSQYLEHTAEEERVTQPLLWKYFTDEELMGHRGKIMAKIPPETMLTFFKYIIPAQSHNERVGLLMGFRKMASDTFYEQGMDLIKQALTEREFNALEQALSQYSLS